MITTKYVYYAEYIPVLEVVAVRLSTDKDLVALPFYMAPAARSSINTNTGKKMALSRYKDIEPTTLDIARRSGPRIAAIINPKYISIK